MKRYHSGLAPVVLAALFGAPAAMAQPVNFDQALQSALHDQPAVLAREAQLKAREQTAAAAAQLPDPRVTAGITNLPVTGPNALDPANEMMSMFEVGVEQDIPNLAKRHARAGIAASDIGYAHARIAHAEHMTRLAAGQAWIALAYAQQRLALATITQNELRELVPMARSAVASGSARPAQSLEIRRSLLELEDATTATEGERETAQARLARYIPDAAPVADGPLPSADVDPVRLRATLGLNPEIVLADAVVAQVEAATRLAEADKRPDFGVSVSYGKRDPRFGDMVSVMGSMTLPLWTGRRQEPRIRAAEAETAAAQAEREDALRELEAQFEADLAAWRSARQQWDRAREELLPLARERADLETASYAAGRAMLTDVVEAKAALALLELDILKREQAAVEAATKLRLTYREHTHDGSL